MGDDARRLLLEVPPLMPNEDEIKWADSKGNALEDPRASLRRFGRIAFGVCTFLMVCLAFRDEISWCTRSTFQKIREPTGWGFVRTSMHVMIIFKFLSTQVELVKRRTAGYIILITLILMAWDGLTVLGAVVVTILLCLTKVLNEEVSAIVFKKKRIKPSRLSQNRVAACILLVPLAIVFVISGGEILDELQFFVQNIQAIVRHGPNFKAHSLKHAMPVSSTTTAAKVLETGVHILAVGAGKGDAAALQAGLEAQGHTVATASTLQEAADLAGEYTFNALVISEQHSEDHALQIQEELRKQSPTIPTAIRTGPADAAAQTKHLTSKKKDSPSDSHLGLGEL